MAMDIDNKSDTYRAVLAEHKQLDEVETLSKILKRIHNRMAENKSSQCKSSTMHMFYMISTTQWDIIGDSHFNCVGYKKVHRHLLATLVSAIFCGVCWCVNFQLVYCGNFFVATKNEEYALERNNRSATESSLGNKH